MAKETHGGQTTSFQLISNEKYMGYVMMGKSVRIDGAKCDNLDGRLR